MDRISATHLIETPLPVEKAAASLAGAQSSGSFVAMPRETEALKQRFAARVEKIRPLETVNSPALPGCRATSAKGPTVAQIARFDSAHNTKGQWVTRSSSGSAEDNTCGDITVPAGSDSITVWFRLENTGASEVTGGIDSVAIGDLGGK